jgi:hypothetical protein
MHRQVPPTVAEVEIETSPGWVTAPSSELQAEPAPVAGDISR